MSSSSEPISSARSITARLELPRSNCSPRVKYAVIANITTKPITRSAIREKLATMLTLDILRKTAMIFPTSTPLTGSLSGRRT